MIWTPEICLYHGPECLDGFGAAWAVHAALGDAVQYVPVNHGVPIPIDVTAKRVLMVDFSLRAEPLRALAGKAASLFVLDHHKTAQADLREWVSHSLCLEQARGNLEVHFEQAKSTHGVPIIAYFDMDKSGAHLSWEFCLPREREIPALIRHIEDHDLWRLVIPGTREVCAALAAYPKDFALWDGFAADVSGLLAEGVAILRARRELVRDMAAQGRGEPESGAAGTAPVQATSGVPLRPEPHSALRSAASPASPRQGGRSYYPNRRFQQAQRGGPPIAEIACRSEFPPE